jgi:pilus assembly protein Flp/PilA
MLLTRNLAPRTLAAASVIGEPFKKGGIHRMSFLSALIASFNQDEEGQGLAEYALILALIAIVAIVALLFLGGQISSILSTIGASV